MLTSHTSCTIYRVAGQVEARCYGGGPVEAELIISVTLLVVLTFDFLYGWSPLSPILTLTLPRSWIVTFLLLVYLGLIGWENTTNLICHLLRLISDFLYIYLVNIDFWDRSIRIIAGKSISSTNHSGTIVI